MDEDHPRGFKTIVWLTSFQRFAENDMYVARLGHRFVHQNELTACVPNPVPAGDLIAKQLSLLNAAPPRSTLHNTQRP